MNFWCIFNWFRLLNWLKVIKIVKKNLLILTNFHISNFFRGKSTFRVKTTQVCMKIFVNKYRKKYIFLPQIIYSVLASIKFRFLIDLLKFQWSVLQIIKKLMLFYHKNSSNEENIEWISWNFSLNKNQKLDIFTRNFK